jgi:hypothetical protein
MALIQKRGFERSFFAIIVGKHSDCWLSVQGIG